MNKNNISNHNKLVYIRDITYQIQNKI